MTRKSILFLGPEFGVLRRHRIGALQRLGHQITIIEPHTFLPSSWLVERWLWEVGSDAFHKHVSKEVLRAIGSSSFDLGVVDGGRLIGPTLVRGLKRACGSIVNYNIDDPFGKRDKNNWKLYLRTVPFYDLVVVMRDCNVKEAMNCGAQREGFEGVYVCRRDCARTEGLDRRRPSSLVDRCHFRRNVDA